MMDFQEALNYGAIRDFGWRESRFTWSNRRKKERLISKRLDRYVCNNAWFDMFPFPLVKNVSSIAPNHSPILLDIQSMVD